MYNVKNLPATYEEYILLMKEEFKDEMREVEIDINDKYVVLAKKYYEKAAKLMKEFTPFTDEEARLLRILNYTDIIDLTVVSHEYGHISDGAFEKCMEIFEEMGAHSSEEFAELGFVFDLFVELFDEYMNL